MMTTNKDSNFFKEGSIFEDMSLLKIIKTKQGRLNILHHDGSVSVIIPFSGINNTSLTERDFEQMFEGIQLTLDQINDISLSFQFIMVRTNDVTDVDSAHLPTYLRPRADFIKKLADNYPAENFTKIFQGIETMNRSAQKHYLRKKIAWARKLKEVMLDSKTDRRKLIISR